MLLVQSHAESAALASIVPALKPFDDLLLIYSPVVLVDEAAVAKEFDATIKDITEAMEAAARRRDYAGAQGYKEKLDSAVMDKSAKVKAAWKTLNPEQIAAAQDRVFGAFFGARPCENMLILQHPEHMEPESYVEMLNQLKTNLPARFSPGSFVIGWPTAFTAQSTFTTAAQRLPQAAPTPPPVAKVPAATTHDPRYKQLCGLGIELLGQLAIEHGINPNGKHRMALVHAINKAEKAKAQKAA